MAGKFNKGMFFVMSEGEYEYYGVFGLFRALVDIDIKELAAAYKDSLVDKEWDHHNEEFPRWLIENGYVEKIECDELHIGDEFGNFDPVKWRGFERVP